MEKGETLIAADLIEQGALTIGDGYRAKNEELSAIGLPFARAGNIDGGFHFEGADCFPIDQLKKVGNKVSKEGDVVFTSKGTVGRFAFVRADTPTFVYSPQLCFWRSLNKKRLDPRFLFYWMQGEEFSDQADALKGQTDMADYVSLKDQRGMTITIPEPEEQRSIAAVLSSLDDKIENNRQLNRTLEDMASALFQSWFVDFDPVVAKAANRQPASVRSEIAALFPDGFEDTGTGSVPRGWSLRPIKEMYRAMYDGPHATPPDSEDGPVFLGIKNLTGTQIDLEQVRYINEADYPRWTKRVTPGHLDIVMTYEATIGFCALVPPDLRCCLGRRLALVRAHAGTEHFLFHSMVATPFQDLLATRIWSGSTVDRIPLTEFPEYPMLWPGEALIKAFDAAAKPVWEMIHHNQTESRTLAALRDALLPALLSGELRVKDAEKLTEVKA